MEILRFILLASLALTSGCTIRNYSSTQEEHEALLLVDRGSAFLRAESLDEAQAAFLVAYQMARLPRAVDGLGCVAFRRGDLLTAERLFRQAFELDPNDVEPLANLALLYDRQGKTDAARILFKRVLLHEPTNVRARNNFSALLFESHQIGQARAEILMAQAVVKHPVLTGNLIKIDSEARIH